MIQSRRKLLLYLLKVASALCHLKYSSAPYASRQEPRFCAPNVAVLFTPTVTSHPSLSNIGEKRSAWCECSFCFPLNEAEFLIVDCSLLQWGLGVFAVSECQRWDNYVRQRAETQPEPAGSKSKTPPENIHTSKYAWKDARNKNILYQSHATVFSLLFRNVRSSFLVLFVMRTNTCYTI